MAFENTTNDPEATLNMPRDFSGRSTIGALFTDRNKAQQAIQDLKVAGFTEDQIGVAMRDSGEQGQLADETGVHTHAGSGATKGAVVGGVLGLLVGLGALAIPGVGPVIAGGVLAHALGAGAAGAVTGAAAGGILGGLLGLGIPEHEARHFEIGFNQGRALVTVNAGSRATQAIEILERDGGDTGAAAGAGDYAQPKAAFPTAPAMAPPASTNQDTVRREEARIENPQNVDVLQRGTTTAETLAKDNDGELDRDELVDDVNINQNPSRSL